MVRRWCARGGGRPGHLRAAGRLDHAVQAGEVVARHGGLVADGGQPGAQRLVERLVGRLRHRARQIGGVAGAEMQAGQAVGHFFGHASDAGADHRATGGERFLDDHRRVLPPGAGHQDVVARQHQLAHVGIVVRHRHRWRSC